MTDPWKSELFADAEEDKQEVLEVTDDSKNLPELNYSIRHENVETRDFFDDWNARYAEYDKKTQEAETRKKRRVHKRKKRRMKGRKRREMNQKEFIRMKALHKTWLDLKEHFDDFTWMLERKVRINMCEYHKRLHMLEQTYQRHSFDNRISRRNAARSVMRKTKRQDRIFAVTGNSGNEKVNKVVKSVSSTYVEKWLIDSGSTVHLTNNNKYLVNASPCDNSITVGTGDSLNAKAKGTIVLRQVKSNKKLILHDVLYVPEFNSNIISVSNLLQKGYTVIGNKNNMTLRYNDKTMSIRNTDTLNMFYFYGIRLQVSRNERENKYVWNVEDGKEDTIEENNGIEKMLKNKLRLSEDAKIMENDKKSTLNKLRKKKEFVKVMDINEAHDCFGHMDEPKLKALAKRANIKLTGKLRTCVGCMEAKAQRKNVQKWTATRAKRKGERIFMDTSGPFRRSINGHKYWFKLVDDFSRKNWNFFMKKKKEVPERLEIFLKQMRNKEMKVDKIRCDNAGEHQSELKRVCNKYNVCLEFVAPSTPQHNGVVERSFTTDLWRLHAMTKQAQLTKYAMNMLWPYAVKVLERIKNNSITSANENNKTPNDLFGTPDEKIIKYLVEFGRIGYVTIRTKIKSKLKPRSKRCVMVGYAENHSPDTYLMYDPRTRKIIMSRDIRWADFDRPNAKIDLDLYRSREDISVHDGEIVNPQLYQGDPNISDVPSEIRNQGGNIDMNKDIDREVDEQSSTQSIDDYNSESDNSDLVEVVVFSDEESVQGESDKRDVEHNTDNNFNQNDTGSEEAEDSTADNQERNRVTRSQSNRARTRRMENVLRQLDTSYNPTRKKRRRHTNYHIYDTPIRHKIYNTTITSDPGEPTTIKEAMNGKDCDKWKPSIKSEIMNFIKRKSWEYVSIDEPKSTNRKIIPCKWVFKIKKEQDGSKRYKSRLCVKGFHQVPGVDYTESFSPVATDSTIQILLLYTLWKSKEGWGCEMFDVEAAFLNAELENVMYLAWPEYMVELGFITQQQKEKECIKLVRSMYGNVDAALRWQKCFVETCIDPDGEIKCEQSKADPCLLLKKDDRGKVVLLIVCYVDDVLLSGTKDTIKWFKEEFKRKYNITELGRMKKHLGMWYEWKNDDQGELYIKVTMDDMLKDIVDIYEKMIGKEVKMQETPGYPKQCLTKLKDENKIIKQKEYRSLVGKMLYYVNKMDIPCSNAIRELAQHLEAPGEEHWKYINRMVGFLKTRIKKGKIIRKPKELRYVGWSDSDYAKAKDRKSITGNITTLGGSPVHGSSKGQSCVCLSSTEAEYVALSTLAQEMRFGQQLLDEIAGDEHQYPGILYEDNLGAMFLSHNRQVGQRTKHIDIRYHFIRNMVEDNVLKVEFTRSENNYADILTKNLNQELFNKHASKINNGLLEYGKKTEQVMMITSQEEEMKTEENNQTNDRYRCWCCGHQEGSSIEEERDMEEPEELNEEDSNASEIMDILDMDIDEEEKTEEEKSDTTEEKADPEHEMTEEERKFYDEAMEYMDTMVENTESAEEIEEEKADIFREREKASQERNYKQDNVDDLFNEIMSMHQQDKSILANRILKKENRTQFFVPGIDIKLEDPTCVTIMELVNAEFNQWHEEQNENYIEESTLYISEMKMKEEIEEREVIENFQLRGIQELDEIRRRRRIPELKSTQDFDKMMLELNLAAEQNTLDESLYQEQIFQEISQRLTEYHGAREYGIMEQQMIQQEHILARSGRDENYQNAIRRFERATYGTRPDWRDFIRNEMYDYRDDIINLEEGIHEILYQRYRRNVNLKFDEKGDYVGRVNRRKRG